MFDFNAFPIDVSQVRTARYFDADWYRSAYPDVGMVGLDPAEHFIRYGSEMRRDPGPDFSTGFFLDTHPGRAQTDPRSLIQALRGDKKVMKPDVNSILWAAQNVALQGDVGRAVRLAEQYMPDTLAYTTRIIRANAALRREAEGEWLQHLNAYLDHYKLEPLHLNGTGPVFNRLSARLATPVTEGPLISVIMPAWNAENTIAFAAGSILNQTWRNLELLIIDDCSTDGTWPVMQQIASTDSRVRIFRNTVNTGPYVSKNLALTHARGDWITGHDADDWALPRRLENHLVVAAKENLPASITYMIRLHSNGAFSYISKISSFTPDGAARKASISCLFERRFLDQKLGFWDAVRFGADSEIMARTEAVLGDKLAVLPQISMLCLDLDTSLTNHSEYGVRTSAGGMSEIRIAYRNAWSAWHRQTTQEALRFDAVGSNGRYTIPPQMAVPQDDIRINLSAFSKAH